MGREGTQAGGDYENESHWKLNSHLRVKELHISSPILAAKSPFFYKLFSNGMRESEQRHVTLSIDASEEVAVMELLSFMYTNSLSVTTAPALLEVLMAADKFEVPLCMKHCSSLLLNLPMTEEFALLLLELPSSIQAADSVEPLINAARKFIPSRYQNMSKLREEELMALPLVGLEAIIAVMSAGFFRRRCLRTCSAMGPNKLLSCRRTPRNPRLSPRSLHPFPSHVMSKTPENLNLG